MTRAFVILTLAALSAAACTDSKRASRAATWGDQPADITCWTYGTENFNGRSTGKVEYDEGGRVSFVDAATNRYTTIEGDCRVVYRGEGQDPEGESGTRAAPPAATLPDVAAQPATDPVP
jgi:hypothetical protein